MSKNQSKKPTTTTFAGERIAKRIAATGLCSRRQAEEWIAAGRVSVNGNVILSPALNVTSKDKITVNDQLLTEPKNIHTMVWKFHKPVGCLVTRDDPSGRPTIFGILPKNMPAHVMPIGRLDFNSEGLLLLTNDGDLAQKLMRPSTGVPRTYRVRIRGSLSKEEIVKISKGIKIGATQYRPMQVETSPSSANNVWVKLTLTEGKNREIRKIMDHLGHPVSRLVRLSYGPIQLGKMEKGECLRLSTSQIENLLHMGKH